MFAQCQRESRLSIVIAASSDHGRAVSARCPECRLLDRVRAPLARDAGSDPGVTCC
jgi:hypothetical protein